MRFTGWSAGQEVVGLGACIGVLMMPGETAFTRMPLVAYSIASALVAELRPPLVRLASTVGTPAIRVIDQAGGDVDDVAGALLQHLGRDALRDVEEAGEVGRDLGREVLRACSR